MSAQQIADEVRRLTASPADWISRVRLHPDGRWYERIHLSDNLEVWLESWLHGQSTGFHDHGGSSGAFAVVWGTLEEKLVSRSTAKVKVNQVEPGTVRAFGPQYVHDVRNASEGSVAVSVHGYSPPLQRMNRYNLTPGGLTLASTEGPDNW